jgi:2-polyprenyl-3-methyl-5-hydroxy-6-metoxy-1,4-benzoquinol methylase
VTPRRPPCPHCGGKSGQIVEVFELPLYECEDCRLIFPFPYPSQDEMVRRHQSEEYAAHPYFAAGEAAADEAGLGFHHQAAKELAGRLPSGSRLLDVGAGTGDFLKIASSHFSVAAVEPSEHLARRLVERIQCPLHVGPFETYQPAEPFDAIVMIDIIEHVADPRGLLAHARRLLKPGGLLFIATVDSQSLLYRMTPLIWHLASMSRQAGYVLRRIYCYQHNWYFNRRVLNSVVQQSGFEVVDHRGYEFPLTRLRESPVILLGLRAIYGMQAILGANTEQWLLASPSA